MISLWPKLDVLLAVTASEGGSVRELVTYELRRLAYFDDPRLFWGCLVALLAAVVVYVLALYRREQSPLPLPLRGLLPGLRLVALAGVVLFFLGLEKRVDQQIVTDSEVLLLIDTSQSMSVEDEPDGTDNTKTTRGEAVSKMLAESSVIETLQQRNDVSLLGFDLQVKRLKTWPRRDEEEPKTADVVESDSAGSPEPSAERIDDWQQQLQPRGIETRLGDALKEALQPSSKPLAGIILVSDGGQNIGIDPLSLLEATQEFDVPIFSVGVGSSQPRRNVRVLELSAPARLFPKDHATVRALIQGEDFAGRSVDVELLLKSTEADGAVATPVGQQRVTFDEARQTIPLQFEIEPAEIGRLTVELRIAVSVDDQYPDDNSRQVEVEVVETKTRVLLVASGATRDYRFLRDQLRRDRYTTVDVLLQNALPGISQGADSLLTEFPRTKEELYPYDCIVAFDPNWALLDAQQADLLESWVAEESGGLIVVAGPIHTSSWVQSPELAKIRALYPVEFQRRLTLLDDGLYGSKVPWPIEFSREGEESDFLWLADSAAESRSLWSRFAGIFGCYAVKGPKPGARVLGRYSDPDAGISVDRPVYLAEHFYGGGRVFYMGSGELWRLRSVDTSYFEILYTRLIRHVSQGRLLRGSSRGSLLVERDRYTVGDDVVVRAQLTSASREPLQAERVTARIISPRGEGRNLVMIADGNRPGNFVGQFSVRQQGAYRVELAVPDAIDDQLVKRIQVYVPDLEFEQTRRNEPLLVAIAAQTGGLYYTSLMAAAEGSGSLPPVAQKIESRAEEKILRGAPDQVFAEQLNRALLAIIGGALCLEWLLRRLMKLA